MFNRPDSLFDLEVFMKIRIAVWLGEAGLIALAVILAVNSHIEGAIGVAGIIGATMDKVVEREPKNGKD